MTGRKPPAILLALAIAALAGCNAGGVKDEGDATGSLGAIQGGSPADVYVDLAIAYLQQQNYTAAMQNARKALAVSPNHPSAHNTMALVYQSLGQHQKAEEHFSRAVELDPRDPFANNAFGTFLCGLKRYDEADRHFKAAISNPLNPQLWVPLTNAGACASSRGDDEAAETYLRKALRTNPRFALALKRMAQLTFRKKAYMSTRAYLQRYLEVAPHTAETLWLGIKTERILGDKDLLASYELLLRERFPDSEEARKLRDR